MLVVSDPPHGLLGHRMKFPNLTAVDEAVRLFIGSQCPSALQHAHALSLSLFVFTVIGSAWVINGGQRRHVSPQTFSQRNTFYLAWSQVCGFHGCHIPLFLFSLSFFFFPGFELILYHSSCLRAHDFILMWLCSNRLFKIFQAFWSS